MNKPLIGITTAVSRNPTSGITTLAAYIRNVEVVERAGGIPVLIPCTLDDASLRALYERLDGVLLPGGSDIDSKYWNEALHPKADGIDPARDHTEITLAKWAVEDDLPLFGICRGHQVFNVAMGSGLIQDIPSQVETPLKHDNFSPNPRDMRVHEISVDSSSKLAHVIGQTSVSVNSLHHQAVREASPNVSVTAKSPDGLIEATEMPDKRFVLTVQWHPEDLAEDEHMFNLFRAFIEAARSS